MKPADRVGDSKFNRIIDRRPGFRTRCCLGGLSFALLIAGPGLVCEGQTVESSRANPMRPKLRYLGMMLHLRHSLLKSFAPAFSKDGAGGSSRLSWRVHLLPFIGEPELYEEFHFDEPWDSPHNKLLLPRMPAVYGDGSEGFKTRFQVFTGAGLLFGGQGAPALRSLRDGAANTILIVVTAADRAVPWTAPVDLAFDAENPARALGIPPAIECIMADGRLASFPTTIPAAQLAAFITPAGGEVADVEPYRVEITAAVAPAVQAAVARQKEAREIMDRLKKIGSAMQNYQDHHRMLPVANQPKHYDESGRPKLSWRVHILQFLDQEPLYRQFKLDEAWDSPHNRALLDKMPAVYGEPADRPGATTTRFMIVRGAGALYDGKQPPKLRDIKDHHGLTALVVRVGADRAVAWTRPDDAEFDPQHPKSLLGTVDDAIYLVTADGAVKALKSTLPDEMFRALMTTAGGEEINQRELQSYSAAQ